MLDHQQITNFIHAYLMHDSEICETLQIDIHDKWPFSHLTIEYDVFDCYIDVSVHTNYDKLFVYKISILSVILFLFNRMQNLKVS